jgi:hypothetical protein
MKLTVSRIDLLSKIGPVGHIEQDIPGVLYSYVEVHLFDSFSILMPEEGLHARIYKLLFTRNKNEIQHK